MTEIPESQRLNDEANRLNAESERLHREGERLQEIGQTARGRALWAESDKLDKRIAGIKARAKAAFRQELEKALEKARAEHHG